MEDHVGSPTRGQKRPGKKGDNVDDSPNIEGRNRNNYQDLDAIINYYPLETLK